MQHCVVTFGWACVLTVISVCPQLVCSLVVVDSHISWRWHEQPQQLLPYVPLQLCTHVHMLTNLHVWKDIQVYYKHTHTQTDSVICRECTWPGFFISLSIWPSPLPPPPPPPLALSLSFSHFPFCLFIFIYYSLCLTMILTMSVSVFHCFESFSNASLLKPVLTNTQKHWQVQDVDTVLALVKSL